MFLKMWKRVKLSHPHISGFALSELLGTGDVLKQITVLALPSLRSQEDQVLSDSRQ